MSRASVVVVEDDPDVASFLEMALGELYDVKVAFDGVAAQRLLDETTPDLVVLDVRLPLLSGVELCRTIRSSPRLAHAAILVVTGYPRSPEVDTMRAMGVDRVLTKPVTARRLLEAARSLLSGPRTAQPETSVGPTGLGDCAPSG